jgi:hypothetical protein
MPWARIDDGFFDHPKIEALTDRAFRAHIAAICLANRYLTDGVLTNGQVLKIANKPVRKQLISAGLWEPVNGCDESAGIRIHDFLDYNRDAVTVKAERQRNAERQKEWRERKRNAVTDTVTNAVTNGVSNAAPSRPDPSRPEVMSVNQKASLQTEANYELPTAAELRQLAEKNGLEVPSWALEGGTT